MIDNYTKEEDLSILKQLYNGQHLETKEQERARKLLYLLDLELKRRVQTMKTYAERVRELEEEGLTTSDAQGVADAEVLRGAQYD